MKTTEARMNNMRLIFDKMCWVEPGSKLLVVADDYYRAVSLRYDFMDVAKAMGADAVLAVFKSRTY